MARYERSVYEPEEEIRVFDGSEDDEDAEGSRLPLLIVLALLVLAMFAGVVWLAYTQGVARGRGEAPTLVARATGTASPGAAQSPYTGFKIYEQPAPADDETDPGAPSPSSAAAAPAPPVTTPMASAEPSPAPAAPPVSAPPQAAAAAPAAPPVVRKSAPPPAASRPVGPATAPPKQLGAAAPPAQAPVPKPAPAPVQAAAASGAFALQIGAYKSEADAATAWRAYQGRHAALLAGYSQDVQRADLGDKGVWYRLRISGFPSPEVADAMCDRLKADGGSCFLAR